MIIDYIHFIQLNEPLYNYIKYKQHYNFTWTCIRVRTIICKIMQSYAFVQFVIYNYLQLTDHIHIYTTTSIYTTIYTLTQIYKTLCKTLCDSMILPICKLA